MAKANLSYLDEDQRVFPKVIPPLPQGPTPSPMPTNPPSPEDALKKAREGIPPAVLEKMDKMQRGGGTPSVPSGDS